MNSKVTYKGLDFDVEYDWEPAEPKVINYGDGSGYPGKGETFSILDITYKGKSFFDLLEDNLDDIELLLINQDTDG